MSFDINKIRERLARLQGKTGNKFWKPKVSEKSYVRLLSFPDNEGEPFKSLMFYYNIGNNRGLLAPSQFNKPDPFQELINSLQSEGGKENLEMCKKLYPKARFYAPVVVRGEEDKGVQIWGFGKTVMTELYKLMADEELGDITDPATGRDVIVESSKAAGKQWATTTVRPRIKQEILSGNKEQIDEWMNNIPNPDTIFSLKSYDELSKIINDWLADDFDTESDGTSRGRTSASTGGDFTSLDDAFKQLSSE